MPRYKGKIEGILDHFISLGFIAGYKREYDDMLGRRDGNMDRYEKVKGVRIFHKENE